MSDDNESVEDLIVRHPDRFMIQYIMDHTQTSKKIPKNKAEKNKMMENERIMMINQNSRHVTSYNLSQKSDNNSNKIYPSKYNFHDE